MVLKYEGFINMFIESVTLKPLGIVFHSLGDFFSIYVWILSIFILIKIVLKMKMRKYFCP